MRDFNKIIEPIEHQLDDYILWKNKNKSIKNFKNYVELTANTIDLFKYATILYPKFILVENSVVLEDHYSKENWDSWRKKLNPKETANLLNHVHLVDYFPQDFQNTEKYHKEFGEILSLFWQMAVDEQFPERNIRVLFEGDIIDILN